MPRNKPFSISATAANGRAEIRIEGAISSWSNSSAAFRSQLLVLVNSGVRDAHVYLNSQGGSVLEANEIVNEIRRFPGRLTGEGGALVASAATNIASELEDFAMPENGMYMFHKGYGYVEGNEDGVASYLVMLKKLTQQYRAKYAKQMGKTEEEVEAMWAKGDVWLTAQEAKDLGLIARISDAEPLTEEDVQDIAACGAPKDKLPTASAEAPHPTTTMDIKVMRATLGMPETATEAEVLARVSELSKAEATAKTAEAARRAADSKALIDAAIKDRKITEGHRAGFTAKFNVDFDATKAELESIQAVGVIGEKNVASGTPEAVTKGREAWGYDDWGTKDIKGLTALMKSEKPEERAQFEALYQAKYGVTPPAYKA